MAWKRNRFAIVMAFAFVFLLTFFGRSTAVHRSPLEILYTPKKSHNTDTQNTAKGGTIMNHLFGKPREKLSRAETRKRKRVLWREQKWRYRRKQTTEDHYHYHSDDPFDQYKEDMDREAWGRVPASRWLALINADPEAAKRWLDAHPGFMPANFTHYGMPGTEPWRPTID